MALEGLRRAIAKFEKDRPAVIEDDFDYENCVIARTYFILFDPARYRTAAEREELRREVAEEQGHQSWSLLPISADALPSRLETFTPHLGKRFDAYGFVLETCACRKSNTHIQMMESAKKSRGHNATNGKYGSRRRRVLVE
jgi:hypothetical protein